MISKIAGKKQKNRAMQKSHRSPFLSNITQLSNRLKETIFSSRPLATANICNVVLMRNHELFTGIEVKDKDGNVVGTSKIAARKVFTYEGKPSRWLDIGTDFFPSRSINTQKRTRPISSHLERTSLVNRGFIRCF